MEDINVRLNQIADHYKLKSYSDFAKKTGISHQTASNYMKGKQKPDAIKLALIIQSFDNIDANWLLTGDGDMLKSAENGVQSLHNSKSSEPLLESQEIPLYDIEVTAGVVTLFKNPQSTKPIDTIKIPNMPKCDGAMTVTGDSMYPLVKSGDIVFYKTISDLPQSIFYGNMYIVSLNVEGDELVMLKYIQKGKDDNHLLLVSENRHHADKEVHIQYINGIALVKGNVRFNFTT